MKGFAICVVSFSILVYSLAETSLKIEKFIYELEHSEALFDEFIDTHKKQYENDEEYRKRHSIFKKNLEQVNKFNEEDPHTVYGVNAMSDLSYDEFLRFYTGFNSSVLNKFESMKYESYEEAPERIDWREKNVVSIVKNQLRCASCYVFSAIANIESQYAIKHGNLISLSEQYGLDCVPKGCVRGGSPLAVMEFMKLNGGAIREEDLPYAAEKGECKVRGEKVVQVTGTRRMMIDSDNELANAVAKEGPLSVALAVNEKLQHYSGGIFHAKSCDPHLGVNHAVLLVGYDYSHDKKYWIVKNSWGEYWGEKGYLRIEKGHNACKIKSMVSQSTVA